MCKGQFDLRKKFGYTDYEYEKENLLYKNIVGRFLSYDKKSEINSEPIIYIGSFIAVVFLKKL